MVETANSGRQPAISAEHHGGSASLAAGFLAGASGGLLLLAAGLVRDGADFVAYWPTAPFAAWLIVRSVAVYALVLGLVGLVLGGLLHPFLRRGWRVTFALVLGAMVASLVIVHLTAWWQIQMLAGLPMDDPARVRGALFHALVALASGVVAAALGFWVLRLRRGAGSALRPAILALGCALVLLVLSEVGLSMSGPRSASPAASGRPARVIVVGLDGMTLRVLSPLLRAGELPGFRRLMNEGAWGTFLTYGTASSPQVWTTMATGMRVRDHGIDDFVKAHDESGANYRATLLKSSDRRSPAVWNILSDAERRVAVVDWLVTFPPEEVNGYVVSRLKVDAEGGTYPSGLGAELVGLWSERPAEASSGGGLPELQWNIDRVFSTAGHLLQREPLDFLAVFDATADRVEHLSWKYYEAAAFDVEHWQIDPAQRQEQASLIPDVYRHLDRRLNEIVELAGEDALVLVVSDHGQRAATRPRVRLRLDRVLADLGYARLRQRSEATDRVDYAASRAYTLVETPWKPVLRVNLNLRGREARGRVDLEEAAGVAERLAEDLRSVRFEDGTPLFSGVTLHFPRAATRQGADLRVALSRHARGVERSDELLSIGERPLPLSHYQQVNTRVSGAHDHQGVFFARGPGVEPGFVGQRVVPTAIHDLLWHLTDKVDALDRLLPVLRWLGWTGRASTVDLTPTVLYALGLPVGRDMFGRPLTELFSDPPQVEWTASYATDAEPRRTAEDEPSDERLLERLRSLGYVE